MIQLIDALKYMEEKDENGKARSFSIKFVTYNRKTGEGGEIISIPNCTKCVGKQGEKIILGNQLPVHFRIGEGVQPERVRKNPNHFQNSTRNLLLPNGQIRKVHIRLIIEFNNEKVFY